MCEHIVGLLHYTDYSDLATLDELREHIEEKVKYNQYAKEIGLLDAVCKQWSIRQYADWRVSTDLKRFVYCPKCGKKIDWKTIRESEGNAKCE